MRLLKHHLQPRVTMDAYLLARIMKFAERKLALTCVIETNLLTTSTA